MSFMDMNRSWWMSLVLLGLVWSKTYAELHYLKWLDCPNARYSIGSYKLNKLKEMDSTKFNAARIVKLDRIRMQNKT